MADESPTPKNGNKSDPARSGITGIRVSGFKSLQERVQVELCPLTVLAGANSSGKSSLMQPLLLMKQTLEASYDAGALLLDGPNVRFTSADQLLSKCDPAKGSTSFSIGCQLDELWLDLVFRRSETSPFDIESQTSTNPSGTLILRPDMSSTDIVKSFPPVVAKALEGLEENLQRDFGFQAKHRRSLLKLELHRLSDPDQALHTLIIGSTFERAFRRIIHVPGLRGNPERTYSVSAVGDNFPGTFEKYVASIISVWGNKDKTKLEALGEDLRVLGLTWKVSAQPLSDTEVNLKVGRLATPDQGEANDLVSIADVGFGVSQVLPVLVALRAAGKDNLVYLEQPEIHLHPRAQIALADVLADAAKRGVRMVVETHSALILLRLQTLIASGQLSPTDLNLVWFTRDERGATHVEEGKLDEDGAFGSWPVDFGSVILDAEFGYLDAVERRAMKRK